MSARTLRRRLLATVAVGATAVLTSGCLGLGTAGGLMENGSKLVTHITEMGDCVGSQNDFIY